MASEVQTPLCWPIALWPESDSASWELNCTPGDPFDDPRYGATLRAGSLDKARKGYGRWLNFLAANGWLEPDQPAAQRVTRPRLRAYLRALKAAGNADYTIIGRITELTMALKIIAPGEDVSWIRRPDGVTIYALLLKAKRPLLVPDAGVLFDWGLKMMDTAQAAGTDACHSVAYRDGLLIAMLASRGRRLRSMALLRVGHELFEGARCYRVELKPEQVKTNRHDRFDLPECLTPYIRHYLTVVRPALLAGRTGDALWINSRGGTVTPKVIQNQLAKLSRRRFGISFGPHRFRHAIATTAALRDPGHPGLAAGVLGGSAEVIEQHYNRAGQIQATQKHAAMLEQRRRRLSALDGDRR